MDARSRRLAVVGGVCFGVLMLGQLGGLDTVAPASAQTRTHILDRTVSCRVEGVGAPDPARYITASAFPRRGTAAPLVYTFQGEGEGGFSVGFVISSPGRAWLNRSLCAPANAAIALSRKGLRGGRTQFGEAQRCEVPARILIRVRAVFARSFVLRTDPDARYQRHAVGRIVTGSLAVATPQGRPIAFATADDATGKAAIFVSTSRCFAS